MTKIYQQRMTTDNQNDLVVFLVGMRFNKIWKIHQWLPVFTAMPKMLRELYQNPELGLLSHEMWFGRTIILVQYWQSFEQLQDYAKNQNAKHLPAWAEFNRKVASSGDIGLWHETYRINGGRYDAVYNNMPLFGLAKAMKNLEMPAQRSPM